MQRNDGQPKKTRSDKIEFTQKDIRQAINLYAYGLSYQEIANIYDISISTFEARVREIPELAQGLLKEKSIKDAKVVHSAYEQAVSGKCPTMTIFWLKCRRGWKDTTDSNENVKEIKVVFDRSKKAELPGKDDDKKNE